jgi:hypothetical protein
MQIGLKPAFAFATANTSNLQQRQTNRDARTARNIFFFSKLEREPPTSKSPSMNAKKEQRQEEKSKPIWQNRRGFVNVTPPSDNARLGGCCGGVIAGAAILAPFAFLAGMNAPAAFGVAIVVAAIIGGVIGYFNPPTDPSGGSGGI